MSDPLVLVHVAGTTISLERTDELSFSVFGGPLEYECSGVQLPRPLHQVALLSHNQVPSLGAPSYIFDLPLVYGMRYSGGTLHYTFSREGICVRAIEPLEASDSWPYRGFPDILPYYPLRRGETVTEDWTAFSKRAPNLSEAQPCELVVLIPPPFGLGFTLWGRGGDAEGVTLVFECNLTSREVVAYNVCS